MTLRTTNSHLDPVIEVSASSFKAILKLSAILTCYGFVFFSLVQFGFWLFEPRKVDQYSISVFDWLRNNDRIGPFTVFKILLWNFILLLVFGIPHTFLSQRKLIMTEYWKLVHYQWEIDKAIYNLVTSLCLQILMIGWQSTGLYLWKIDYLNEPPYNIHFFVHVFAWAVFYGTNLMIDLPDLIGLNQQVMIACPTSVVKSPNLQNMMETQRHMGFLPFAIILLVHPCMSLDRFLLTIGTMIYSFAAWRSQSCYPYAKNMRSLKHKQQYSIHNNKDG